MRRCGESTYHLGSLDRCGCRCLHSRQSCHCSCSSTRRMVDCRLRSRWLLRWPDTMGSGRCSRSLRARGQYVKGSVDDQCYGILTSTAGETRDSGLRICMDIRARREKRCADRRNVRACRGEVRRENRAGGSQTSIGIVVSCRARDTTVSRGYED